MKSELDLRAQLGAALCGPAFVLGYLIFWGVLGHNTPPPSMGLSTDALMSSYFNKYHSDILLGMTGCAAIGILYLPWAAQLCVMMRRDTHNSPVLANIELLGGGITAWLLAECPAMWAHAAYVSAASPVLAQSIWQGSWFIYDLTYPITTVEMIAIGVYALTDRSIGAPFPRWTGWLSIGGGLSFLPLSMIVFTNRGPFAMPGAWNFWIVFSWWLVWFSVISYYMIADIVARMATTRRVSSVPPAEGVRAR